MNSCWRKEFWGGGSQTEKEGKKVRGEATDGTQNAKWRSLGKFGSYRIMMMLEEGLLGRRVTHREGRQEGTW